MTQFKMDLDDAGIVRVHRSMLTKPKVSEFARAEIGAMFEAAKNLDWPSDEDFELLYNELERGASGVYSVTPKSSEE